MRIGMIGLGDMGAYMVRRLIEDGCECVAYDKSAKAVRAAAAIGAIGVSGTADLLARLPAPRIIWMMVPAAAVDEVIGQLRPQLAAGDVLVDGGNSHYADDIRRADALRAAGIHYLDVGTSRGVLGLVQGYCLMVGGDANIFATLEPIFAALSPGGRIAERRAAARPARSADSAPRPGQRRGATNEDALAMAAMGYLYCGPSGAGHFVKMVLNGIEYGVMAAYAEGLSVLRGASAGLCEPRKCTDAQREPLEHPQLFQYRLDIAAITEVWRHGSIISSKLLDLMARALAADPALSDYGGGASDSGEERWAVQAAIEMGVPAHVLSAALYARFAARGNGEFADKAFGAMRLGFGGQGERKG
jgi:6-phosphogluconate dehydrogenase